MRDYQRQRVYDAEHVLGQFFTRAVESDNPVVTVQGITLTLPPEGRFGSVESIQGYVNRVLTHPAVKAQYPWVAPNVTVRRRKGTTAAHYSRMGQEIAIPDETNWALRELVVLHEIAHHLAPGAHGPRYTNTYLGLLEVIMGPEVALVLRILYDAHRVDHGNKKAS